MASTDVIVELCQESSDEDSDNIVRTSNKKKHDKGITSDTEENYISPKNASHINITPRSSERLREKSKRRHTIPKRKEVLDKICDVDIQRKYEGKSFKRRSLTSDFVRGSSRYVTDSTNIFESSGSDLSDFIDDSDETKYKSTKSESKPTKKKKKKLNIEKRPLSSDCDTDVEKEKKSCFSKRKKCNNNLGLSDEWESGNDSDVQGNTCARLNKLCRHSVITDDEINSDEESQEEFRGTHGIRKKQKRTAGILESDEDNTTQNDRNLRRRTKSSQKEKEEKLLAKISAKRKFKSAQPNTAETNGERSLNDEELNESIEETSKLIDGELEEGESDREFVVDDDFCDADSDGVTEFFKHIHNVNTNNNTAACVDTLESPKKNLNQFQRICALTESEESDDDRCSSLHMSAIYNAMKENNVNMVQAAIVSNPTVTTELNSERQTLLHYAVMCGSVEITQLLVDLGCDKLALDVLSLPPPVYAVLYGHTQCLKILLQDIDLHFFNRLLEDHFKLSFLHFAVYGRLAVPDIKLKTVNDSCLTRSLQLFFEHDNSFCLTLMQRKDLHGFTPLVAAIVASQCQCVEFLLSKGANVTDFQSKNGGNLLHFAVECSVNASLESEENQPSCCLGVLLTSTILRNTIDATDISDFTPLMYAAQSGNYECVLELLTCGASVHSKDKHGTTSLHLAAASGDTNCVKLLLEYGHKVDCLDSFGWPPLLYANFAAQESCVLALMEPNPKQIFVLADLLKRGQSDAAKERNFKVVKDVLVALANQDAYYRVFNDFIRENPDFLEQYDKGLLHQTWRGILDFDNKQRWFKKKLSQTKNGGIKHISLEVIRDDIFESAMCRLKTFTGRILRNCELDVTFKDEPGICTGPRKEFFVNICKDIVDPKHKLFHAADDNQYSLVTNVFFSELAKKERLEFDRHSGISDDEIDEKAMDEHTDTFTGEMTNETTDVRQSGVDNNIASSYLYMDEYDDDDDDAVIADLDILTSTGCPVPPVQVMNNLTSTECTVPVQVMNSKCCVNSSYEDTEEKKLRFSSFVDQKLAKNLDQLKFLGKIIGTAICQGDFINLHLAKPLVKQIIGIKLHHPDDLGYMDYQLHKNFVSFILENDDVGDLMLPCFLEVINPWNGRLTTVKLFPEDRNEECLTDDNKAEFLELVSKHKLTLLIQKELDTLCQGLYEVIPKEFFSLYTADEFSLLINGVGKIDIKDWQNNTKYSMADIEKRNEIKWFWEIVSELKEEEKALLLKFSTGSPCVPAGGFAQLQGLGGKTKFQICMKSEHNKIPTASTCFNMLKLTSYDSRKELKDKLLIAIRHGTEGFSFS